MKTRKIPLRTCVITREKHEKKDLLRIVKTPEGKVKVDITGKANGRGAYIFKDLAVVEKARKSNALGRSLECIIPKEIYDEIVSIINE